MNGGAAGEGGRDDGHWTVPEASWRRGTQTDSKALEGEDRRAFQHLGVVGSQAKALQVGLTQAAQ